jgi:DNA-directed RNA polymerase specialized sigma24 family protein
MHLDTNTNGPSYDDFIVGLIEPVQALARKHSRDSFRVEADDLFSIGMVKVCEVAARAQTVPCPRAYALKSAENGMIDELRRVYRFSSLSLDAPLTSEDGGDTNTLADTLTSPSMSPLACPSGRERAVASAVRWLRSRRQRAVLRRSFALVGYGVHDRKTTARFLGSSVDAVDKLRKRGVRSLRSDARLRALVGVEVAG